MKVISPFAFAILTILAAPASSKADDRASGISKLLASAQNGFATSTDVESIKHSTSILGDADECQLALQLSAGKQLICSWKFEYRDADANEQFLTLNAMLHEGLSGNTQTIQDQDVNHPDFYDLRTYESDGVSFAVSLKDKATLEQTYVFLRVSRQGPAQK